MSHRTGSRRDRRGWPDAALAEQLLTLRSPSAPPRSGHAARSALPPAGAAPAPDGPGLPGGSGPDLPDVPGGPGSGSGYGSASGAAGGDERRIADLMRVLDAAARPLPVLPAREAAALAAFRQARADRAARRRRRSVPVKALVSGIVAVFALGGVAVAAQQGRLVHPFHGGSGAPHRSASPDDLPVRPPSPSLPSAVRSASAGTGTVSPPALTGGPQTGPQPAGVPTAAHGTPGLKGLCESYLEPGSSGHLSDHSMQRLVQAAGGADRVGPYCVALTSPISPTVSPPPTTRPPRTATSTHPATPPSGSPTPKMGPAVQTGSPPPAPSGPQ